MRFGLAGVGTYEPRTVVTSDALDAMNGRPAGTSAAFGIRERRYAQPDETSSFMGAEAARLAIADAGWDVADVEAIIGCCGVMEQPIPGTAPLVQRRLGLGTSGIPAFDVNATCLSFLPALDMALAGMSVAMLSEMIARGAETFVSNVSTRLSSLEVDGRTMPLTVDDGVPGGSYVCSPHSAYALYARDEIGMVDVGMAALPARAAIAGIGAMLRAARMDRIVHLGNWMLSTNLHGGWRGEELAEARRSIVDRFPDHLVGVRSIDDWSSPGLRQAMLDDGWVLVPSRQVWVVDDLAKEWRPRGNHDNDRRALARSGLAISDLDRMSKPEAARIAELYRLLYVERYSAFNPILTAAFVETSHRTGMLSYRVARNAGGTIMAVAGMWERGGTMTPPVVGYDIARPQSEALYRIACWMFMERAMERGWRLHGSPPRREPRHRCTARRTKPPCDSR